MELQDGAQRPLLATQHVVIALELSYLSTTHTGLSHRPNYDSAAQLMSVNQACSLQTRLAFPVTRKYAAAELSAYVSKRWPQEKQFVQVWPPGTFPHTHMLAAQQ